MSQKEALEIQINAFKQILNSEPCAPTGLDRLVLEEMLSIREEKLKQIKRLEPPPRRWTCI